MSLFNDAEFDLVVFSHLRWEFVTQRPQHLINRLGEGRKVLFLEEPIEYEPQEEGTAKIVKVNKNITVLQPKVAREVFIKNASILVSEQMRKLKMKKDIVLWFYSPMFVDVTKFLSYKAIVYDCMDELSLFRGAPKELVDNEKKLLNIVDVVFTGGKSLYESKKKRHSNVHCFPSSVEKHHFAKALDAKTLIPQDIKAIQKPVVGYYGVIDERIDLELIEKAATLRPEVSFVMIGPVVKINEEDLPRRNNIHYLGSKPYETLPNYLKAFDIAFMPFALNDATKFISPTKTLEFMAAGKPIISTPIFDVVRDYSEAVAIIHSANELTAAVDNYIAENIKEKQSRLKLYTAILAKTSWDNTAKQMKKLIQSTLDGIAPSISTASQSSVQIAYD
jgi:glycosyltransferase involved in cell wall biosynthesis